MRSQTAFFRLRVAGCMRGGALLVPVGTSCRTLVARMAEAGEGCAVITWADGRVAGIVTENDITRRLAFKIPPDSPVEAVMSAPVVTAQDDGYLYHALGSMRRHHLRHMVVVDAAQCAIGLLDLEGVLEAAVAHRLHQIDLLTQEDSRDGIKHVKAAQGRLAAELLEDNLPAPEILALLSHFNNDLVGRVIRMSLAAMEREGWGPQPVEFAALVMGSGGRLENSLIPDQDNAFVLADYPDAEHNRVDGFFIELALRMTRDLNAAGFPYCSGNCMATNPLWRKTLSQWREQIAMWGRKRDQMAILLSDIFFDFRVVHGSAKLARELRGFATGMARGNSLFLQMMYFGEAGHPVGLRAFGRFLTESGSINVKRVGTLPLVEAVRLASLREGVEETETLKRIEALRVKGVFAEDEADHLSQAFAFITGLLLRQQIADLRDGTLVASHVWPDALSRRERDLLLLSFKAIESLQKRLKFEFTGNAL